MNRYDLPKNLAEEIKRLLLMVVMSAAAAAVFIGLGYGIRAGNPTYWDCLGTYRNSPGGWEYCAQIGGLRPEVPR